MPIAVVTGASSGIGAATARQLAAAGYHVVLGARRVDRLEKLAAETGGTAVSLDVTDQASVDAFADAVRQTARRLGAGVHVLVNNAGGARGADPVDQAKIEDWQWMFEVNVIGVVRVTKALVPDLDASGAGHIVIVSSTAGHIVYEGGGGYTAAKHGATAVAETLRLELSGRPIRVSEIAPGMVRTDEFAVKRLGSQEAADKVYDGVAEPLTADDIADCITWTVTRPPHVDIDLMVIRPLAQAAQHKVHRVK